MTEPDREAQVEYFYREGYLHSIDHRLKELRNTLVLITSSHELTLDDLGRLSASMEFEAEQLVGTLKRTKSLVATLSKPFDPHFA
jgi:hypothetical protein